jgi:hypothetical protein
MLIRNGYQRVQRNCFAQLWSAGILPTRRRRLAVDKGEFSTTDDSRWISGVSEQHAFNLATRRRVRNVFDCPRLFWKGGAGRLFEFLDNFNRDDHLHSGSTHIRGDFQSPADFADSLAHTRQTDASPRIGPAEFFQHFLRYALAIVYDGQGDGALALKANLRPSCSRVAVNVSEALL